MQHNRQANLELSTDLDKETDVCNKQADKQANQRFPNRLFLHQEITKLLVCYRRHLTSNLNLIIFD